MHIFLDKLSAERPASLVVALGVCLLAAIGALDYLVGYRVSFSIFFLVPIMIVTWYGRPWLGYGFCFASAGIWALVDHTLEDPGSSGILLVWNSSVRLGFFLVVAYLLANIKRQMIRQEQLAVTDGLTGLLNARAFRDGAYKLLELALRHHLPVAMAYIDIDDFKRINDTRGHAEGDRVLVAVADALARTVRASDIVGRVGGDEFVVFLPETDYEGAQVLFERIFDELVHTAKRGGWPIGFSVGVAVFRQPPATIDHAMHTTDSLMYRVKQNGKHSLLLEEAA